MSTGVLDSFKSRPSQQTKKKRLTERRHRAFAFWLFDGEGFWLYMFWLLVFGFWAFGFWLLSVGGFWKGKELLKGEDSEEKRITEGELLKGLLEA
jgi:hypothetical protein